MPNDKPISEGDNSSAGAGCGIIAGAVFALFGVGAIACGIVWSVNACTAQSWSQTPCQILTAQLDESHGEDGTTYRADFTYQYHVAGVQYVGQRDTLIRFFGSRRSAKDRLKELPVGSETICWVNPTDPADAVLDAAFPFWSITIISLMGLIFASIGGSIAYVSVKQQRATKRRRALELDSFTPEAPYFRTDVIDRDADRSDRDSTAAALVSGAARVAPAGSVDPADAADREADTPQRLKAETSRWGMLAGVTFIALFWNGIVGVFVWVLIFDPPGGMFTWGLGLFLVPFVLIGLALIAAVFHSAISMFNPVVSIALSTGAVPRGGLLDVAWEVSGGVRSVQRLRINLIGTEWARYQRGTDTITDESTFEVVPVVSTDQREEITFGSATVAVPEDTMHTLELSNNKIKWSVSVSGVIPWWPDVVGNYPFRVMPIQRSQGLAVSASDGGGDE